MEIPEIEPYDSHRISLETARNEYESREMLQDSTEMYPGLLTKTQGCFGPYTLSLAKHGGRTAGQTNDSAAAIKSLIRAYKQNQEQQKILHTYNDDRREYIPDDASTTSAFDETHSEGNTYCYYLVNWRRCQFINTRTDVYYGNCPQCYQAYPLGKQCTKNGCTDQIAKAIYFREPGPRMYEPAIPHELGRACGNTGQRFVIDEYELLDNKRHQTSQLSLPRVMVGYEIHTIERFLWKTSPEFRNKPHFWANVCCIIKASQTSVKNAINLMIYTRVEGRPDDFTEAQADRILRETDPEHTDEFSHEHKDE